LRAGMDGSRVLAVLGCGNGCRTSRSMAARLVGEESDEAARQRMRKPGPRHCLTRPVEMNFRAGPDCGTSPETPHVRFRKPA